MTRAAQNPSKATQWELAEPMRRATVLLGRLGAHGRGPVAVVRDGDSVIVALGAEAHVRADGPRALGALDDIWAGSGFWAGAISYDLGRSIERVTGSARRDRPGRDVAFTRFATRVVFAPRRRPTIVGTPVAGLAPLLDGLDDPDAPPGREPQASGGADAPPGREPQASGGGVGPMCSTLSRADHAATLERVHRHLRDGDCYQVNVTRRLSSERRADPRALFRALALANPAPHAALVELEAAGHDGERDDNIAVVSASPERFLHIDGTRIETRPIKGTHRFAGPLGTSSKDLAEHVMIVDMARNDLGRVCELGSVAVSELCAIECHPGLAHMVSTACGTLAPDVGLGQVVGATFPPASITGAPKPRVMQIIDELEPVRRGYYCGAVGWIDADTHRADLAVAIRTFVVSRCGTDLGVGGGIVADSDTAGEWDETRLKANRLLHAAGACDLDAEHDHRDIVADRPLDSTGAQR